MSVSFKKPNDFTPCTGCSKNGTYECKHYPVTNAVKAKTAGCNPKRV